MSTTISGTSGVTFPDSTSMQTGQQACKAWVNFTGTGTVAIAGSYNVSSVTDNGIGDYTVNFTTAMPDVNYSAVTSTYHPYNGTVWNSIIRNSIVMGIATSACRVGTGYTYSGGNSAEDREYVYVAVFSN